jgi:EAL domain-containing protein (putative c-di-GMP-specific phosphodiesterase class I)
MASSLRLVAATPDMRALLTGTLAQHDITFRGQGDIVIVESDGVAELGRAGWDGVGQDDPAHNTTAERVVNMLRQVLSAHERETVSVLEELSFPNEFPAAIRLDAWRRGCETSWFDQAFTDAAFSMWFQPVVDTTARRTIGHECLIRLIQDHRREGAEIMAAAESRRDLRAFDSWARQLAVRSMAAQRSAGRKPGAMCFVNFLPSVLGAPSCSPPCSSSWSMEQMLRVMRETETPPESVVLEAVDANRNSDVARLRRIGDFIREQGMSFALDDVGANAEALRLVCELRPDYIKLEKRVVHRMEQPREAAAVRKLVEVAQRLGVRVIAKAVERVATMELLWMAGVQYMQGYLFGSPTPDITGSEMDLTHLARAIQPAAQSDGLGLAVSHSLAS